MHKKLTKQCIHLVISVFSLGYWPASGTLASIFACGVMHFFYQYYLFLFLISLIFGFYSVYYFLKLYNTENLSDPSFIVIDEVSGYFLGYCILYYFSMTRFEVIFFLLFRFFDIVKPLGIKQIEKLPGVFGIMLDDYLAALYSVLFLLLLRC